MDLLAKDNLQQSPAGGDRPRGHAHEHHQKALEVAWPCAQEGQRLHLKNCSVLDPGGEEKERLTKATWRRTVESELRGRGYSWGTVKRVAKDRTVWRSFMLP